MEKAEVSVIVPVYNVADYLDRCIDSLICQTLPDIEIVLVDDCSTDLSGGICDSWQRKFDNIVVVHHSENKGVAGARNTGLQHASGKYIGWVDGDDWVDPTYFEDLFIALKTHKADMAVNMYGVSSARVGTCEFRGRECVRGQLLGQLSCSLWRSLSRRSLFANLLFKDYAVGEDADVLLRVRYKCEKIVSFQKEGYHYEHRIDSATNSFSLKKYESWLCSIKNRRLYVLSRTPSFRKYVNYSDMYEMTMIIRNTYEQRNVPPVQSMRRKLKCKILECIIHTSWFCLRGVQIREVLAACKVIVAK